MTPGVLAYFAGNALCGLSIMCGLTDQRAACCNMLVIRQRYIEPVFKSSLQFLVLVTEEDGFDLDRGKSER